MPPSRRLLLLENLKNAAVYHKQYCKESCNVSIRLLFQLAEILVEDIGIVEAGATDDIMNEFPRY